MKTKIEIWTIQDLYDSIDDINEQPKYQRGAVWSDSKKSLLIDSMLRGVDIPKIYLNKKRAGAYRFEVADGQQRIDAIIKFKNDLLALREDVVWGLNLKEINGDDVGGCLYSDLEKSLRNRFDKYHITVAIIEEATNQEIRTLFGRLQLGEPLKPAEKRNALISGIGTHIDTICLTHDFFSNCRIKSERFNHQDYLSHALTLVAYDNSDDLKANLIERMYLDKKLKWPHSLIKKVTDVLSIMKEIDSRSKRRIVNKFSFIDIFWYLFREFDNFSQVEYKNFSDHYDKLEQDRLANYKAPERLARSNHRYDKDLYKYIMAYRYEGAKTSSITTRNSVFEKEFKNFLQ